VMDDRSRDSITNSSPLEEIDPADQAEIRNIEARKDSLTLDPALLKPDTDLQANDNTDIRSLIKDMTLPQKVKAAMFGNATCRALLIKDSQRVVQEAVLKNPQLQEREVHDFLKGSNTPELVIRRIADSKQWMKSYQAKYLLVSNPKTPIDLGLKWVRYLRRNELKRLAQSKGVSQVIATAARKRSAQI